MKIGDTVRLITPDEILTPFAPMLRTRAFKVVGIFSLGLFEFDSEYALVDLPVAERVFGKDKPDFMQVKLDDMFVSQAVAEDIQKRLGQEYATQDWAQMNKSLFSALWLEKMAISITIGLIIMVAAAQHRRLAGPAGHGEEPRHCHPEDDGEFGGQHPADFHAAGTGHRHRRHRRRHDPAAWR